MYYLIGINPKCKRTLDYCSLECRTGNSKKKSKRHYQEEHTCKQCSRPYLADRKSSEYCSSRCQKIHASGQVKSRSRAEKHLEFLIQQDFPELKIEANNRSFLESNLEIDLFFPELNLALEVNGPCHYNPIYGRKKLKKTQKNDLKKEAELNERNVHFMIIDISSKRHNTWAKSKAALESFYHSTLKKEIKKLKRRAG